MILVHVSDSAWHLATDSLRKVSRKLTRIFRIQNRRVVGLTIRDVIVILNVHVERYLDVCFRPGGGALYLLRASLVSLDCIGWLPFGSEREDRREGPSDDDHASRQ